MNCPHCHQPIPDAEVLSAAGTIQALRRRRITTEQARAMANKRWQEKRLTAKIT